jgi:molecular chaperone DnaJ
MKDYYKILGISRGASQEEIKKAFHRLAHKHHPHKGGDEAKFKEVNEAYQVLSNKEKRAQYDQFGTTFEGAQGFGGGAPDWGFQWQGFNPKDVEFDFDSFGLGDIFGDIFGFGAPEKSKKDLRKGKDIQVDMEITLEEVMKGSARKISLIKMNSCSRCKGTGAEPGTETNECFSCRGMGQVQQVKRTVLGSITRIVVCPECGGEGAKPEKPCNVCKGEGRVRNEETININIPAGVDTNQVIRMEGKGEAGKKGGKSGNLYIRILVKKHPVFNRKGDDLYIQVPITFSQAALGDEIEVPTLEKTTMLLKVPDGTESGRVLRISGKGIPHFSSYGRGNLYVELMVKTPRKLTKKQKELLDKLKEEGL